MRTAAPTRTPPVGAERKKGDEKQQQITFRISSELHGRLSEAADGLELDVSSLLRTMIREQLPVYEERADEIRQKEKRKGERPE